MADFLQLDENLLVAGQMDVYDIVKASETGIKMIICNRPDGESDGQVPSVDMEALLKTYNIDFRYIPITPGEIRRENVIATKKAFDEATGPILAYCRSGMRSTVMWAMVQAALDRMSNLQIIKKSSELGYDLNPIMGALTAVRDADLSS